MTPDIKLRPAVPSDAMQIAIVQAYTWKTTYTGLMPDEIIDFRIGHLAQNAERIEAVIRAGKGFLVAESRNAVVGFARYGPSRNADYPADGEVEAIYILRAFQGSGVGRELFRRCQAALWREGHRDMLVNCLAGNPSRAFYERMGGRVVGQRSDVIAGGTIVEDILRFRLAPAEPAAQEPPLKTLYLIGGTMGVGKTAVGRALNETLDNSVFLDGDWCWSAHPFQVTEETKQMVMRNICGQLNNFLHCTAYRNVVFCWVMHEQAILDELLARLDTEACRVVAVSLVCSRQALAARLQRDIARGLRSPDVLARSEARLPLYEKLSTVRLDTTECSVEDTVKAILAL